MADPDPILLAELLCARLCHDLAGPVGAVATGAELLAEEAGLGGTGLGDDALALLTTSAATAGKRLKFLRAAFGTGSGMNETGRLRDLAADFFSDGGLIRLDWGGHATPTWNARTGKLLLNLLMIARDCLPRGGSVIVRTSPAPEILAEIRAEGTSAQPGDSAQGLLSPKDTALSPKSAQGAYAAALAQAGGIKVTIDSTPGTVRFVIIGP